MIEPSKGLVLGPAYFDTWLSRPSLLKKIPYADVYMQMEEVHHWLRLLNRDTIFSAHLLLRQRVFLTLSW